MGAWDVVIDVSNVCWSPHLPPLGRRRPYWNRLRLIMAAWREEHGDDVRFHLVADESLARSLDDPAELEALKASGVLFTTPVADAVILPQARVHGLHVITRDHYVDHRTEHPWIELNPERFHGWDTDEDGHVRIVPLGITPRSAQEVSMVREIKDLKRTKLDHKNPLHRQILHTRWKCGNASCVQAAHGKDHLLVWPLVSAGGKAICPSCLDPLIELGPRAELREVVVAEYETQVEIIRFPLEAHVPVIVGRGTIKGIDLTMNGTDRPAVRQVSRLHLLMRIEEVSDVNWRLAVIDLNSTNGTIVERWAGTSFLPSRPVPSDRETVLSARDRLVLGGTVLLRLSGKRFVKDAIIPAQEGSPEADGTEQTAATVAQPAVPRAPEG